jgi:hypothetical protein
MPRFTKADGHIDHAFEETFNIPLRYPLRLLVD